jgi:hypothetical protein
MGLISLLDGGAMMSQPILHPPPPLARIDTATVPLLLMHPDGSQNRIALGDKPESSEVQFAGFTATAPTPC